MSILESGRRTGGKRSRHDPRDHRLPSRVSLIQTALPQLVDLRASLPPIWNQGPLGACELHGGPRAASVFWPKGFMGARLAGYWDARTLEGTTGEDDGVETRDMLKTLQQRGLYDESHWPYDFTKVLVAPPDATPRQKIGAYSRISNDSEAMAWLAGGSPIVFACELPDYFDAEFVETQGILKRPPPGAKTIGGHCLCAVGYDAAFKSSAVFAASGLAESDVDDVMALVANSWGPDWGIGGHFWAPFSWIFDSNLGQDAWALHAPPA